MNFGLLSNIGKKRGVYTKKRTTRITRTGLSKNNVNECWFWTKAKP